MEPIKHKEKCTGCGKIVILTGKGKWREDIQAYEWYESDHSCPKINEAAKALGQLGGLMTSKIYGTKHFSEAGKKGMKARWNK